MNKKLDFIDSLRGYAIMAVVFTHVGQLFTDLPVWLNNLAVNGARGVQLFFVVSAFTLMYSLHKKYEKKIELKDFFIKRFFRIAPAFYFALVFYSVVDLLTYQVGLSNQTNDYSLGAIFSVLTFTNLLNIDWLYSLVPGGWSISAEMLYYLIVPLLFFLIKNLRSSVYLLITSIIVSIVATQTANYLFDYRNDTVKNEYFFHWFPNQLPVFCFGILLYHLWKNLKLKKEIYGHILIFISLLLLFFISIWEFKGVLYFHNQLMYGLLFTAFALGLANVNSSKLVNKASIFIGKISFSMYLVHFFVLDLIRLLFLETVNNSLNEVNGLIVIFLITLLFSSLLSYLSYLYIEQSGIRLGRKAAKKIKRKDSDEEKLLEI